MIQVTRGGKAALAQRQSIMAAARCSLGLCASAAVDANGSAQDGCRGPSALHATADVDAQ
jgi:hypothetical protein